MTQTQQRSLISIVFITLIAGLIVSLNVDNQDAQSGVSVITPSNANTSVDNRAQVTPGNNTNAPDNIKQTQDPFSSGGSGLGKPGGKRGSLLTASLLAWFKWLFGLNGSWVCLILSQQKSLISIIFIALIVGLIVSLNVDNQDAQSDVSVITPP
jgi:hypothetical protein